MFCSILELPTESDCELCPKIIVGGQVGHWLVIFPIYLHCQPIGLPCYPLVHLVPFYKREGQCYPLHGYLNHGVVGVKQLVEAKLPFKFERFGLITIEDSYVSG